MPAMPSAGRALGVPAWCLVSTLLPGSSRRATMRRTGALMVMLALARPATAERAECLVRFAVSGATGDPDAPALVCRDGDSACDADATTNGTCEIAVAVCGGPAPCDDT